MSADETIEARKDAHLDVVLERAVGSEGPATGLGGRTLEYDALPELELDAIDLRVDLFGKTLRAPIVVGAMTGGTERAKKINRTLARAAERVGVGLALGSQRAMIAKPEFAETFMVREVAPTVLLFGNVGAVQLNYGVDADAIEAALRAVEADALNFHLNPLQEAVQPEGDTNFAGLLNKIDAAARALSVPVLLKEVGAGIGETTAGKIAKLAVDGVETAGVGGTSWARVESHRAPDGSAQAQVGARLAGFGIPTADSIVACRRALGDRVVIGSGGVRGGMDVAVGLALGADAMALAKPMLEAAVDGVDAVVDRLQRLIYALRVIMFCTGAPNVAALRSVRVLTTPTL